MTQPTTLSLPITKAALRLLTAEAKANGLTVEQQAARSLEEGFGVSAAHVIERVLDDARNAAAEATTHGRSDAAETQRAA
jgi:hypothetical protein